MKSEVVLLMRVNRLFLGVMVIVLGVVLHKESPPLWGASPTITHVSTEQKVIALTIDDGPHYKTTPEILAVLKEKNVRATFFVLGVNVDERPDIMAQEIADGHEVEVHAYRHNMFTKLNKVQINEEFQHTEQAIHRISSAKPLFFRPPGGLYNDTVIAVARERGYSVILWSIDPRDWARPSVNSLVDTVLAKVAPGDIILLHDGQYPLPTPKALPVLIDRLREQGYEFVTISELMQLYNVRPTFWQWF